MDKIRLLALDIDDTIVDSSLVISERNIAAINAAFDKGIKIVLCTGRGYYATRAVRQSLNVSDYLVCFGGAYIVKKDDGAIMYSHAVDSEDVVNTLKAAYSLGLHAQIYQGDAVIFREENEFTKIYTSFLTLPFEVVPDLLERRYHNVPKVLVYSPPEHEQENIKKLRKLIPDRLHILSSKPGFIEIGEDKATKGQALKWIAKQWGISQNNVAAIGDNTLDLDMIEWAGCGCCVANGNPVVKAQANMILPSCKEDGVAYFIENFILR
ncbi:MAG: Cof-type HAD-IIB family hydrolase [Eubacteriales bacterium]|nr:Cof-type HAD-IIB family hydrolase [Eubacteriales bacterium]